MDFINEIIQNIAKEQDRLDLPVFLNFLKEELDRKGIVLTVNRTSDLHLVPMACSNIVGVELDTSEHDKGKDAEIETCVKLNALLSKQLEKAKRMNIQLSERYESLESKRKEEFEGEIEKYKQTFEFAKRERDKAVCEYRNEIDALKRHNKALQEELEENKGLPYEPIDVAKFLIYRENYVHDVSGLRQIAEHLLVYCNHAEVE